MSRIYYLFALLIGAVMLVSISANPPDGHTGAPGEGLCTACHSLNGGTQNGSITLSGFPSSIIPGMSYVLTITNSNPNGVANIAGFQMTVLNSSHNKAGDFSSPGAFSTISSLGGRQYWDHNPAQLYGSTNMVSWTVTWTAPNGPPGEEITFYAAGNVANHNMSNTGDLIVTSSGSGTIITTGDPLEVAIIDYTDLMCFGDNSGTATAEATGGTAPYTYEWSNNATGAAVSNLSAGTHTVTVTDLVGSTATASVTLSEPPAILFGPASIENINCFGDSDGSIQIIVTGGSPGYDYLWSNGQATPSIDNLAAGTYTVTVTDQDQCTAVESYEVTQPGEIMITTIELLDESCLGEEDGSITIAVTGGVTPIFVEWSNGSIGNSISELEPGNYSVTVTDNNLCSASAEYEIQQGSLVDAILLNIHQVTCNGGNDGALSVQGVGGVVPYTYEWSNGAFSSSISGLEAGVYLLTITDGNNCTTFKAYTITEPGPIVVTVVTTDVSGQGANDGTATASATGGIEPLSYLWSNGSTESALTDLPPGTYTVTVTDANGCTAAASGQVNAFGCELTVELMSADTVFICEGTSIGLIPVTENGGFIVGYIWSNGSSDSSIVITPLNGETTCVTVTDDAGCTASDCVVFIYYPSLVIECPVTHESAPGANDGAIGCDSIPGVVAYAWTNGETTPSISGLAPGDYCLAVIDENGCLHDRCFTVNAAGCDLVVTSIVDDLNCFGDDDASISLTIENAAPPVMFAWSNGDTLSTISGLTAGIYIVTVTDANGCMDILTFQISQPDQLIIVIDSIMHANDHLLGSGYSTVTGGTPPYTVVWTHLADFIDYFGEDIQQELSPGFYQVVATDANSCQSMDTVTIEGILGVPSGPEHRPVAVYPVPAQDWLVIHHDVQMTDVWITGIDGRLVRYLQTPQQNRLDVSQLPEGMYILRMTDGTDWYLARFIK